MTVTVELIEKAFLFLMIYSILGWLYESTLCSVRSRKFINRGFLNGPYCPIYGWGAVLDIAVLGKIENPVLIFLLGAVLTCTLEYLTSFFMEKLFHARWWDYSERKFNLNGRVCLIGALVFGTFSVVLIKFIHPLITGFIDRIPTPEIHIVSLFLISLYITDSVISLVGFTGFNTKLHELSLLLEQKKEVFTERLHEGTTHSQLHKIYESFPRKFNFQQRRMLNAFPKLRSVKYNDLLIEVKKFLHEHF